jgi:hypothetical protein
MRKRITIKEKYIQEAMCLEQRKVDVRQELLRSIVRENSVSFSEAKKILAKNLEDSRKHTFWNKVKEAFNELENR